MGFDLDGWADGISVEHSSGECAGRREQIRQTGAQARKRGSSIDEITCRKRRHLDAPE
jgi:hypothetical protein